MGTKEDPATPAFWDARFRDQRAPWDAGSTPPDLGRYLAQESGSGRVLIPGCGLAYELRTFSEKGYEVVAIDFSVAAVARAKELLVALQDAVVLGDSFSYDSVESPSMSFTSAPFSLSCRAGCDPTTRIAWGSCSAQEASLSAPLSTASSREVRHSV